MARLAAWTMDILLIFTFKFEKGLALVIDAVCNQSRKRNSNKQRKHTCHGTVMKCTHV